MSADWEGLLLIDKPAGPTSHDVVDRVRRLTGLRRVGHAGTLDPPATGLLPVVLGRATRLIRFLPDGPKLYSGTIELGRTTETDDAAGATLARHAGPLPAEADVRRAAAALTGRLIQVPPRVSARKLQGRRQYDLARRGVAFEPRPSEVEVYRFEVAPAPVAGQWRFEVAVSRGTYVRSLARDLGAALGCGATLATLRREAVGPLAVTDAIGLPETGEGPERLREALIPVDRMPLVPPGLTLDAPAAASFVRGQAVPLAEDVAPGFLCAHDPSGRLLGVGESSGGRLRPRVVLAAPLPD